MREGQQEIYCRDLINPIGTRRVNFIVEEKDLHTKLREQICKTSRLLQEKLVNTAFGGTQSVIQKAKNEIIYRKKRLKPPSLKNPNPNPLYPKNLHSIK